MTDAEMGPFRCQVDGSKLGLTDVGSGRRPSRRARERGQKALRASGSNSVVESQPSKLLVAGSIPVSRSSLCSALRGELRVAGLCRSNVAKADVAQLAERVLGKDEVTSSILVIGSSLHSDAGAAVTRRLAGSPNSKTRDVSAGARRTQADADDNDTRTLRT